MKGFFEPTKCPSRVLNLALYIASSITADTQGHRKVSHARRNGSRTQWPYPEFRNSKPFKREPSRRKRREPPRTSAEETSSDKLAQDGSRSKKSKKQKNKDKKKKKKRRGDTIDADPLENPRNLKSGENLPSKSASQRKVEGRHTFIINLEPRVECDFCDEKFMTFQDRSQHYTDHHQVNVDWGILSEKTRHWKIAAG